MGYKSIFNLLTGHLHIFWASILIPKCLWESERFQLNKKKKPKHYLINKLYLSMIYYTEHCFCNVFLVSMLNFKFIYHGIYWVECDYECDLQMDFFLLWAFALVTKTIFFKKLRLWTSSRNCDFWMKPI